VNGPAAPPIPPKRGSDERAEARTIAQGAERSRAADASEPDQGGRRPVRRTRDHDQDAGTEAPLIGAGRG
jgi:hypothetical protein